MPDTPTHPAMPAADEERWGALAALEDWLETPMLVLSFAWLVLVVVELAWGTFQLFETFGTAIWIAFQT